MLKPGLEQMKVSLIQHRRNYSLGAAWLAFVLVLVFAPRLKGPRIIEGIPFMTKTGVPGLTDLGLALLVIVPVVTFFAIYSLLWWLKSRHMSEEEEGT